LCQAGQVESKLSCGMCTAIAVKESDIPPHSWERQHRTSHDTLPISALRAVLPLPCPGAVCQLFARREPRGVHVPRPDAAQLRGLPQAVKLPQVQRTRAGPGALTQLPWCVGAATRGVGDHRGQARARLPRVRLGYTSSTAQTVRPCHVQVWQPWQALPSLAACQCQTHSALRHGCTVVGDTES
jgi:hypothetical protein